MRWAPGKTASTSSYIYSQQAEVSPVAAGETWEKDGKQWSNAIYSKSGISMGFSLIPDEFNRILACYLFEALSQDGIVRDRWVILACRMSHMQNFQ